MSAASVAIIAAPIWTADLDSSERWCRGRTRCSMNPARAEPKRRRKVRRAVAIAFMLVRQEERASQLSAGVGEGGKTCRDGVVGLSLGCHGLGQCRPCGENVLNGGASKVETL